MAREQFANALKVAGAGLGQWAGQRMEREAKELDYLREQTLISLSNDLAMGRQTNQQEFQAGMQDDSQEFTAGESAARREHELDLFGKEGGRLEERYRRDDMDSIRDAHNRELSTINDRIQDLSDGIAKGEYFEGSPGWDQVMAERDQLEEQRVRSEAAFMIQMRDLGAPGYDEAIQRLLGPGETMAGEEDDGIIPPNPSTPGQANPVVADLGAPEPPGGGPSYNSMGRKPASRRNGVDESGMMQGVEYPPIIPSGVVDAARSFGGAVKDVVTTRPPEGHQQIAAPAQQVLQAIRGGRQPYREDLQKLSGATDEQLKFYGFTPEQIQAIRRTSGSQ